MLWWHSIHRNRIPLTYKSNALGVKSIYLFDNRITLKKKSYIGSIDGKVKKKTFYVGEV